MSTNPEYKPRLATALKLITTLKNSILMSDQELSKLGKEDSCKQSEILQIRIEELLERELTTEEIDELES